ncbi:MAG: hypothetical protein AAGF30_06750 [Pseudomonadota bacterium]
MQPHNMTDWHRADLDARLAQARANLRAEVEAARMTSPPSSNYGPEPAVELWNKMGHYAMIVCIWAAMIAPILLIISFRT